VTGYPFLVQGRTVGAVSTAVAASLTSLTSKVPAAPAWHVVGPCIQPIRLRLSAYHWDIARVAGLDVTAACASDNDIGSGSPALNQVDRQVDPVVGATVCARDMLAHIEATSPTGPGLALAREMLRDVLGVSLPASGSALAAPSSRPTFMDHSEGPADDLIPLQGLPSAQPCAECKLVPVPGLCGCAETDGS
jgi:hypothetical protein